MTLSESSHNDDSTFNSVPTEEEDFRAKSETFSPFVDQMPENMMVLNEVKPSLATTEEGVDDGDNDDDDYEHDDDDGNVDGGNNDGSIDSDDFSEEENSSEQASENASDVKKPEAPIELKIAKPPSGLVSMFNNKPFMNDILTTTVRSTILRITGNQMNKFVIDNEPLETTSPKIYLAKPSDGVSGAFILRTTMPSKGIVSTVSNEPISQLADYSTTATTNTANLHQRTTISANLQIIGGTKVAPPPRILLQPNGNIPLTRQQRLLAEKFDKEGKLALKAQARKRIHLINEAIKHKLQPFHLKRLSGDYFGPDPTRPSRKILSGVAGTLKSLSINNNMAHSMILPDDIILEKKVRLSVTYEHMYL